MEPLTHSIHFNPKVDFRDAFVVEWVFLDFNSSSCNQQTCGESLLLRLGNTRAEFDASANPVYGRTADQMDYYNWANATVRKIY